MATARRRRVVFWAVVCALAAAGNARLAAQAEYRVYADHPRLLLDESQLVRLQRDVERQTLRWQRFAHWLERSEQLAEPGFALALASRASKDESLCQAALDWAARRAEQRFPSPGSLRQSALAFDWCYEQLDAETKRWLVPALGAAAAAAARAPGRDIPRVRDGVFAAIALAGDWEGSEPAIARFFEQQWKSELLPAILAGEVGDDNAELFALLELTHVVRSNLERDLWLDAPQAFRALPLTRILAASGRVVQTPEGALRAPWTPQPASGEALAREALLARIVDLLLVGYDPRSRDFQFLQGWLRNDSFALSGPLGAPYEFLWLNPYLPGLSPASGPHYAFDPVRGRLFARKSWREGALQLFVSGSRTTLDPGDGNAFEVTAADRQAPLQFPGATVVFPAVPDKLSTEVQPAAAQPLPALFLVGLEAGRAYELRFDKGDRREIIAGKGGILAIRYGPVLAGAFDLEYSKPIKVQIRAAAKR